MHLSPNPQVLRIAYLPTRTCPSKAREDFYGAPKAGPQQRCSGPGTQCPLTRMPEDHFQTAGNPSLGSGAEEMQTPVCLSAFFHVGTLSNRSQPPSLDFTDAHTLYCLGDLWHPFLDKNCPPSDRVGWLGECGATLCVLSSGFSPGPTSGPLPWPSQQLLPLLSSSGLPCDSCSQLMLLQGC